MKASLRQRFGDTVKKLRLASGESQEAFADRCGFARSYMSKIERGKANPSLDAIQTLADALKVEVKALFETTSPLVPAVMAKPTVKLVPFARDGSCFNPKLPRPYAVGEKGKGNTVKFDSFDEALEYLGGMKVAKWWRLGASGRPGLVSAVEWKPLPKTYSR